MRDDRIPPLLLSTLLAAVTVYWVFSEVRCGEDECLDRPLVAGIASAFWLAAAVLIMWTPGSRPSEKTALRWAAAVLWPLAAWVCVFFLPFEVVYD